MSLQSVAVSHAAEMSYIGQIHSLRVPIEPNWSIQRIVAAFEEVYRREYGNTLGDIPTVIVSLKTAVRGIREKPATQRGEAGSARRAEASSHRDVYFGQWVNTPIYDRKGLLPGMTFEGPAIVEQSDTTTVVEPGMVARVDALRNILIEMS